MKAVILAAGVGSRLKPLTDDTPKGLVEVGGKPILGHSLEAFYRAGIGEAILVTGHLHAQVEAFARDQPLPCRCVYNPRYDTANNYYSLLSAEEALGGEGFVKVDSDLVFRPAVLARMLSAEADLCIACDPTVTLGAEEMKLLVDEAGQIRGCSKELDPAGCVGESIGMEKIGEAFSPLLFDELRAMDAEGLTDAYYEDAYHRLGQRGGHDIRAVDVAGLPWAEIDDAADLAHANTLFSGSA